MISLSDLLAVSDLLSTVSSRKLTISILKSGNYEDSLWYVDISGPNGSFSRGLGDSASLSTSIHLAIESHDTNRVALLSGLESKKTKKLEKITLDDL